MDVDAEAILEAEPEQLGAMLVGVDLREWLHLAMSRQLNYQTEVDSPGTFDSSHPALDMEQYARLRALGYLGSDALPEILGVLVHPETAGSNPVVWSVCDALVRMGEAGGEATPALLQRLLRDGITEYPSRVVGALVAVSTDRDAIRASLEAALDSPDEAAVLAGLYALPAFEAVSALPRILELSSSPSGEVRSQAALALGALGEGNAEVRGRLLQLTEDPEWFVRGNAIDSLAAMGERGEDVRSAALRILQEDDDTPDWSAPECAARALRVIGGSEEALKARLLRPGVESGLAEECIQALMEAGITGWEEVVREEYGYLFDDDGDDDSFDEG